MKVAAQLRGSRDAPGRTRTVTWEDPFIGARAAMKLSGLDYLRAINRGDLPPPPISVLLDMRPVALEPGRAIFEVDPAEYHFNPIGSVHGGVLATLLDSAMGCAVHASLAVGSGYTTLELKVNFLRRVTAETGPLRCEGVVVHLGRTIATAEARVTDPEGRLVAHSTSTCLITSADGDVR